jgi:hypothetical protein
VEHDKTPGKWKRNISEMKIQIYGENTEQQLISKMVEPSQAFRTKKPEK